MSKRRQTTETRAKRKQRESRPAMAVEPDDDVLSLAELHTDLASAAGNDSIQAQAALLSDTRLSVIQRQALADHIGQVQGNQHLQKAIAFACGQHSTIQRAGLTSLKTTQGTNCIQRRQFRIGSRVVQTRDVGQWRRWLTSADPNQIAFEINVLMGCALERHFYSIAAHADEAERERERGEFEALIRTSGVPAQHEYRGLMMALLTTRNPRLGASDRNLSAATGFFLPMFIRRYYADAIFEIARRSEGGGWTVDPAIVASFLMQARRSHGSWMEFLHHQRVRRESRRQSTGYGQIGAIMSGSTTPYPRRAGSRAALAASAMASMQSAAAAAIGEASRANEDERRRIGVLYQRVVRRHSRALQGMVQHIEDLEELERQTRSLSNAAVDVIFAAAGPFTGGLSLFQQVIASMAIATLKQATSNMAVSLFAGQAQDLSRRIPNAFEDGLELLENECGCAPGEEGTTCPSYVTEMLASIRDGVARSL